jgi:hypothetical protein
MVLTYTFASTFLLSSQFRIGDIAKSISDEVKGEDRGKDGETGKDGEPRSIGELI